MPCYPYRVALDRHQNELLEAVGLVSHRWSRLLDLEEQAKHHPELEDEAKRERAELESFVAKQVDVGRV